MKRPAPVPEYVPSPGRDLDRDGRLRPDVAVVARHAARPARTPSRPGRSPHRYVASRQTPMARGSTPSPPARATHPRQLHRVHPDALLESACARATSSRPPTGVAWSSTGSACSRRRGSAFKRTAIPLRPPRRRAGNHHLLARHSAIGEGAEIAPQGAPVTLAEHFDPKTAGSTIRKRRLYGTPDPPPALVSCVDGVRDRALPEHCGDEV